MPLILETPAHDSDKPSKTKSGVSTGKKGKGKGKSRAEDDLDDEQHDEWEMWKKEVGVLERITRLSLTPPTSSTAHTSEEMRTKEDNGKRYTSQTEEERLLQEWTDEIREVAVRLGGKDALALLATKLGKKSQSNQKFTKKGKEKAAVLDSSGSKAINGTKDRKDQGNDSELTSLDEVDGCEDDQRK